MVQQKPSRPVGQLVDAGVGFEIQKILDRNVGEEIVVELRVVRPLAPIATSPTKRLRDNLRGPSCPAPESNRAIPPYPTLRA